jgi:hypothetical protein
LFLQALKDIRSKRSIRCHHAFRLPNGGRVGMSLES